VAIAAAFWRHGARKSQVATRARKGARMKLHLTDAIVERLQAALDAGVSGDVTKSYGCVE